MTEANPIMESDDADDAARGMEEYGRVLRSSSDRSRYAIYVTTIVTILICIANYNIQKQSWSRRRLATWYAYARTPELTPKPPAQVADGDAKLLEALRSEYVKQFVGRDVMTTSPIPGVSIDINDLGLVGGVALVLLMQIVVICVAREHENVYLALYKVRLIASREGANSSHGNSRANLLYHSLAMGQVLSAPPTLARWEHHGPWHHFRLVFAAPVLVYAWVWYTDFDTRDRGAIYGVNVNALLAIEGVLWLILFTMCIVAALQSRAMALRWEHAFMTVNPHRMRVAQMSLRQWLGVRRVATPAVDLHKRVATCIVDFVREGPLATAEVAMPPIPHKGPVSRIRRQEIIDMSANIVDVGEELAQEFCKTNGLGQFVRLRRLRHVRSYIYGKRWTVAGNWEFEYIPLAELPTA